MAQILPIRFQEHIQVRIFLKFCAVVFTKPVLAYCRRVTPPNILFLKHFPLLHKLRLVSGRLQTCGLLTVTLILFIAITLTLAQCCRVGKDSRLQSAKML